MGVQHRPVSHRPLAPPFSRAGRRLPAQGETLVDCVATGVWFDRIPDDDLETCLRTPEPYDKAGAYAIQGWAGCYVERIDGDWHNVVGLPVRRLLEMLGELMDVGRTAVPDLPEGARRLTGVIPRPASKAFHGQQ